MALLSAPLAAARASLPCVAHPLPAPRARAPTVCALPVSAPSLTASRAVWRSYAARVHGRGDLLRRIGGQVGRLGGWRRASASEDNDAKDAADVARSEDYTPEGDVEDVSDDVAEASAAAAELAAEMAAEAAAQAASVYAATAAAEGMGEESTTSGGEQREGWEEVRVRRNEERADGDESGEAAESAFLGAGGVVAPGAALSAAAGAQAGAADKALGHEQQRKEERQDSQQQQEQRPEHSPPRQPQPSSAPAVTGLRRTVWGQEGVSAPCPPLHEHLTVDVAVVGGGINGLSVAYALLEKHRRGKAAGGGGRKDLSVVVLEARAIGSGQTGRTTAHLMPWNDDYYSVLERLFGRRRAALVGRSHVAAIDWVERVVRERGIECEFERVDGYLFPHDSSDEANRKMLQELAACQRIGVDASLVDVQGDPALGSLSSALRFPNAADFHPLKYLQGLAEAVTAMGGRIHENTRVIRNSSLSTALELNTGVRVTAGSVVLATNSPINHNLAVHARQSADRTYVVGLAVPKGSVHRAQWWDTASPYHYVRIAPGRGGESEADTLIVGGEDHPTGVLAPKEYPRAYERLERWARERWTSAGKVVFRWTGQVYEPVDFLGLYGKNPLVNRPSKDVYVVTGNSGQGMTGGTISGLVVSDLILSGRSEWQELYDPRRLPPLSQETAESIATITRDTAQGYAFDLLFVPGDVRSVNDVKPGEGALVAVGLHKQAVYRTEEGKLKRFSAVCPHLKCAVRWNPNDKTFDCPCHGSQFDTSGQVIQGPAKANLSPVAGDSCCG
ncbi:hypothetical protein CLOM_g12439 [Closterium sp. NIES-68]|nr:hypothetical protein CLOM_g12439 [Closterium sp. NIES-68]GJP72506.1 hypothetical protein CLOP_g3234 [Closterium sp. NIES-67]